MSVSQYTTISDITSQLAELSVGAKSVLIIADSLMNIGDFALCVQTIRLLRTANTRATIRVWQWQRPSGKVREALARFGASVEIAHGKSLQLALKRHDLLVFAGGQLVRGTGSMACLAAMMGQVLLAKLRRARVAAIGIGIGPVRLMRRLAWRVLLGHLDYVSLRDSVSLKYWRAITESKHVAPLTEDLAFGLATAFAATPDTTQPRSIVIAPCYCDAEERGIVLSVLDSAISEVSAATAATHLVFAAHDRRVDKDLAACSALAAHFSRSPYTVAVLASSELSDYAAAYGAASAVITNRLHGIVFALLANRPVIVVDDGCEKIRAAAERYALPRVAAQPCDTDASCVGNVGWDVIRSQLRADRAL